MSFHRPDQAPSVEETKAEETLTEEEKRQSEENTKKFLAMMEQSKRNFDLWQKNLMDKFEEANHVPKEKSFCEKAADVFKRKR